MQKKVVLVTGASSGLGKSIAQYLLAKGFIVYGTSRSGINVAGFSMLKMNVLCQTEITETITTILQNEKRLDILINNAGIGMAGALEDSNEADFTKVISTNLIGPFRVIKSVLPQMRKQGQGLIINVSTLGSIFGLPYRSAYCASKSALDSLTESLRMEVKRFGINVCSIQPGDIRTNIGDQRIVNIPENSAYKKSFDQCYEIINSDVANALSPEFYAKKVYKIISSSRIKRSYILGHTTQKITALLKRILPDHVFERLIMNYYKV
jgi:NAD(P)-dependent dehydrogenase (short-subunit alcohol dehydrogenase family)